MLGVAVFLFIIIIPTSLPCLNDNIPSDALEWTFDDTISLVWNKVTNKSNIQHLSVQEGQNLRIVVSDSSILYHVREETFKRCNIKTAHTYRQLLQKRTLDGREHFVFLVDLRPGNYLILESWETCEGAKRLNLTVHSHDCKDYGNELCRGNSHCLLLNGDTKYRCYCCNKNQMSRYCAPDDQSTYYTITGPECSLNRTCSEKPCKHGICRDSNDATGFECFCKSGFSGSCCEFDYDDCLSSPCLNDAVCEDRIADYRCHCAPGWKGRNCQLPNIQSLQCELGTCPPDTICLVDLDMIDCISQDRINTMQRCSENGFCENGGQCVVLRDGLSKCICPSSFTGTKCQDRFVFSETTYIESIGDGPDGISSVWIGIAVILSSFFFLIIVLLICHCHTYTCYLQIPYKKQRNHDEEAQALHASTSDNNDNLALSIRPSDSSYPSADTITTLLNDDTVSAVV